jgi:hypothetical protein
MKTIQTIVVAAVIVAIVGIAVVVALLMPIYVEHVKMWRSLPTSPFPFTVSQPFDSWGEAWILPPLATAEYEVNVRYERKEGGRLGEDEPLRIKLIDETAGKIVPIEGNPTFQEPETRVGKCHLSEGHQYRVEVDADQVNELGRHHHRLEIDLSSDEQFRRRVRSR